MSSINLGEMEHIAKTLADRRCGGNVSRYIQELIKTDYDQLKQDKTQKQRNNNQMFYEVFCYSILTMTVVVVGMSALHPMYIQIIPFILCICGFSWMFYVMSLVKQRKRCVSEDEVVT